MLEELLLAGLVDVVQRQSFTSLVASSLRSLPSGGQLVHSSTRAPLALLAWGLWNASLVDAAQDPQLAALLGDAVPDGAWLTAYLDRSAIRARSDLVFTPDPAAAAMRVT